MSAPFRFLFALAAFIPGHSAFAGGGGGDIMIDVVVDMTEAGSKVAHPTPSKPAYYLPLPVGYKPQGAVLADQKLPPPTPEVEHMMAVALAQEGYLVMTRKFAPSLVLTIWWGYMAPEINDTTLTPPHGTTNVINIKAMADGPGANAGGMSDSTLARALVSELPTSQSLNTDQMMALVEGNSDSYQYTFQNVGLIYQQVRILARSPRHYLMVSAFDFKDWLHHKATLLWRAHISTELWGHSLDEVLPTMIASGAPMFGRETGRPRLLHVPLGPTGRVLIGTPEVKEYPSIAAEPVLTTK